MTTKQASDTFRKVYKTLVENADDRLHIGRVYNS